MSITVLSRMLLLALAGAGASMAQSPGLVFTKYSVPNPAYDLTVGPDDALWFLEHGAIGRMSIAGDIREFAIPNDPGSLIAGPDGALWFTERIAQKVGRITTGGEITEFSLPCCVNPLFITVGPDGALWFTEDQRSAIGRITTDGKILEYPLPNPDAHAVGIKAAPDGALWFSEILSAPPEANGIPLVNKIGRITTTGVVTEYDLPSPGYRGIWSFAVGSDRALWFTEYYTGGVGRIGMDGVVTEFAGPGNGPGAITSGPDGALWFLLSGDLDWVHTIMRVTTAGEFTAYSAPVQNINGGAITLGPDGALWFVDAWTDHAVVRAAVLPPPHRGQWR